MATVVAPSDRSIQLERLEFGKLCESRNGPILPGVDHRVLGASKGFPTDLRKVCVPAVLGLGETPDERLIVTSGIVLRAIHREDSWLVLYRIGQRLESGPHAPSTGSRLYSVARYLLADGRTTPPSAMFTAMESEPLTGITREEASHLTAFSGPAGLRLSEAETAPFLEQALTLVISGVGIHISAADEKEFFMYVDCLWRGLPPELKPLLSAGWGVGSRLSSALIITSETSPIAARPTYVGSSRSWSGIDLSQTDDRLRPGRIYCALYLNGSTKMSNEDLSTSYASPQGYFPKFPDFSDPYTRSFFQHAGYNSRNNVLLSKAREWVEGAGKDEVPPFFQSLVQSAEPDSLGALLLTRVPSRIYRFIWACLEIKSDYWDQWLTEHPDRTEVAWIVSVHRMDLIPSLSKHPANGPNMSDLPEAALSQWRALLTQSLEDEQNWPLHRQILERRSPSAYLEWAREHAGPLVMMLIVSEDPCRVASVLEDLNRQRLLPEFLYDALRRLLEGNGPPQEPQCIQELGARERSRLTRFVDILWQRGPGNRQTRLAEWPGIIPQGRFSTPQLQMMSDEGLSSEQIRQIVCADSVIPEERRTKLAKDALRQVDDLRRHMEGQPAQWACILDLWPPLLRQTLLDIPMTSESSHDPITAVLSRDQLQKRIAYWFAGEEPLGRAHAERAQTILFIACRPENVTVLTPVAIDICRAIASRQLPEASLSPAEDQLHLAARVLCAARADETANGASELWNQASKGWHLRLLMEAYPSQPFQPNDAQLAALVPHRAWLDQHLKLNPARKDSFALATCEFHTQPYQPARWRDEFKETGLWAVFYGLHEFQRGALGPALEMYAPDAPTQSRCCLRHLDTYNDPKALVEALQAFLIPLLSSSFPKDNAKALLTRFANGAKKASLGRHWFSASTRVQPVEAKGFAFPDRQSRDTLEAPSWVCPLLWKVLRSPLLHDALDEIAETPVLPKIKVGPSF